MTVLIISGAVAAIGLLAMAIGLVSYSDGCVEVGVVLLVFGGIFAIVFGVKYAQAGKEAAFVNTEFGTSYTADDFFWTGDVVMKMIEGEAVRIKTK